MIPVLGCGVYYSVERDDARISDVDVYPPEALDGGSDHVLRVLWNRDVAHDGLDLDTLADQPLP